MSRRAFLLTALVVVILFASCAKPHPHTRSGESPGVGNPYPSDHGQMSGNAVLNAGPSDGDIRVPNASSPYGPGGTLVLYDRSGAWGWLGELYATNVSALAGHFGPWTAKPVTDYVAGEIEGYVAAIYVGSSFGEQIPAAFLDDVLAGARPVVWIDDNIGQLTARAPDFEQHYGFSPWVYDARAIASVEYKGKTLTRFANNASGIMTYSSVTGAEVLAEAVGSSDGAKIPWALRGKNLTYIGENPLTFVSDDDRYLAFCDLLFDALAPSTPERHRALVRIEDVSAESDPHALREIADYLASEGVPFSVAVIPRYLDPTGHYHGDADDLTLSKASEASDAIRYLVEKGGTVVMHGYTHQYEERRNPYTAVSADDFEFFITHVDGDSVVYDGPVPTDSKSWASTRIASAFGELSQASLPRPTIFEYPRYAGSVADSLAVRDSFEIVYQRGLYFSGTLAGEPTAYGRMIGVTYPYVGADLFGLRVIPENLGPYSAPGWSDRPRLVEDILRAANANLVVRDGFASFYFHPYYPVSVLRELVSGIKAQGYVFASVTAL
jgi:uncharacterized protein YdaL